MFLILVAALLPLLTNAYTPSKQCLARKPNQFYNLVSTQTPYDDVRGNVKQFEGCEAKKLWLFQRHASRFPFDYQIRDFDKLSNLRDIVVQNHAQGRGELCPEDLEVLSKWTLVALDEQSQGMLLSVTGIEELRKRGKRLYGDFRHLVSDEHQVKVRISHLERTRQSAEAVTLGLYGKPMKIPDSKIYDELIKNEEHCPAWKPSTRSQKLKEETDIFTNSTDMQQLISRVSQRLGFQTNLNIKTIKLMYDTCRFEYSWYHSPVSASWCAAFSEQDMKIMEFGEDLTYYYKSGYANKLIVKLGCDFVKDIITTFTSSNKKATMYFGHSISNRKLLTALGLANAEPLRGDAYSESKDRLWRTSLLMPFAANVMAVLYECEGQTESIPEKQRITIFNNEKLVRLPACEGRDMCGFEEFQLKFAPLIDPEFCNRDFCKLNGQGYPF